MDVSTLERHALAMLRKPLTLKDALLEVSDFRIDRRKKYPLYEVLMIAVCAMVAGAKGPTDFERFGRLKLKFLKKFLPLQNGIPSHDTFRRVLGKIDPKRFNAALVKWLESASDVTGDVISIDGKLLRRALTKDGKMPCIVSAYSKRSKLVIGQVKAFGVASLRSVSAANSQRSAASGKRTGAISSLAAGYWLLIGRRPPNTSYRSRATSRRCTTRFARSCRTPPS